jgi:hypothetical protein
VKDGRRVCPKCQVVWLYPEDRRCANCERNDKASAPFQVAVGRKIESVRAWTGGVYGPPVKIEIKLEGGLVLKFGTSGGEMDGHFDPSANRSLSAEVADATRRTSGRSLRGRRERHRPRAHAQGLIMGPPGWNESEPS